MSLAAWYLGVVIVWACREFHDALPPSGAAQEQLPNQATPGNSGGKPQRQLELNMEGEAEEEDLLFKNTFRENCFRENNTT